MIDSNFCWPLDKPPPVFRSFVLILKERLCGPSVVLFIIKSFSDLILRRQKTSYLGYSLLNIQHESFLTRVFGVKPKRFVELIVSHLYKTISVFIFVITFSISINCCVQTLTSSLLLLLRAELRFV